MSLPPGARPVDPLDEADRLAAERISTAALGPYTFAEFEKHWRAACLDAWNDGHREPAIVLPAEVFPGLESMINHITHSVVAVRRQPMFPSRPRTGTVDA